MPLVPNPPLNPKITRIYVPANNSNTELLIIYLFLLPLLLTVTAVGRYSE